MDDWQDAAFSTRHMHNRVGGNNRSKHTTSFNVRKTFGSYSVKCPAQQKIVNATDDAQTEQPATLELYRLTENGEGIIGEISLPGALHAAVILAGSRASLRRSVAEMEPEEEEEEEKGDDQQGNDSDDDDDNVGEDNHERDRFETFEKNSFRSPKFWFQWNGEPTSELPRASAESGTTMSELGYIVFTGNDCRKFKGTINCSTLKWKNVAITGHKVVSRSESDVAVNWT